MGSRGYNFRVVGTVIALLCAALAFQNCGGKGLAQLDLADFKLDVSGSTQGNGSGYDGKLYVHVATTACSDALGFDRAIAGRDGKFFLTRDNCLDIPVTEQQEIQVDTNVANPTRIYYQGQIFVEHLDIISNLEGVGSGFVSSGSLWRITQGNFKGHGDYVGRYDPQGRPLWARRYMFEDDLLYQLGYSYMRPLRDGGLVLTGGYGAGRSPKNADLATTWIARFSPEGKIIWNKRVDQDGSKAVRFQSLKVDGSDNTYALMLYEVEGQASKSLVVKFNPRGEILFAKGVPGTGLNLQISPSGGIFITLNLDKTLNLIRLSSSGATIFSKSYSDMKQSPFYAGANLMFPPDDAIIMTANISIPNPDYPQFLESHGRMLELTSAGEIKAAYKPGHSRDFQGALQVTGDGGFLYSFPEALKSIRFARLHRDFSFDWALRKDQTAEYSFPGFHRLDNGQFFFIQSKISSISMYSGNEATKFDLRRPEVSCPQCVPDTIPDFVPVTDLQTPTDGTPVSDHVGLRATEFPPINFEPIEHYLPLEPSMR